MVRKYLLGIFPFAFIFFIHNLNTQTGSWSVALSWWNGYLVLSYLVFFPLLYDRARQMLNGSVDIGKKIKKPMSADQEAMKMGSNYGNTGHMGFARIGDADAKEGWLLRWGMSLIMRLFLILAGPFVWAFLWGKRWCQTRKH